MSVVSIIGAFFLPSTCASGTDPSRAPSLAVHCLAPPGLSVSSHSLLYRLFRYSMVHWVGAWVQAPSRPLVTVSSALPLPQLFFQPSPCRSTPAAAGTVPTTPPTAWAPSPPQPAWSGRDLAGRTAAARATRKTR